ncbi:unnamed protein product, partial [marine sediment metagenome]
VVANLVMIPFISPTPPCDYELWTPAVEADRAVFEVQNAQSLSPVSGNNRGRERDFNSTLDRKSLENIRSVNS